MIALESNVSGESNGIFFHHEDGIPRPRNREATVKNTRGPFQHLSVDIPRKNLICWSVATGQEVDLPDAGKYLQSLSEAYVYNESESGRIHSGEMFAVDHTIQDVTPFLPELEVMEPRPPPDYYPSTRRTDKTLMRCCYLGNQIAKRSSRSVEPLGILENGHPSSLPSHIVEGESKALAATFHLGNLHQDRRDHIGDAPQAFEALFQSDALHDRASVPTHRHHNWEHQSFYTSAQFSSRFLQPAGAHQINIVSPERSTEYSRQLDGLALPSPTVYVCECGAVVETHSNKEVGHHDALATYLNGRCIGRHQGPSIPSRFSANDSGGVDPLPGLECHALVGSKSMHAVGAEYLTWMQNPQTFEVPYQADMFVLEPDTTTRPSSMS